MSGGAPRRGCGPAAGARRRAPSGRGDADDDGRGDRGRRGGESDDARRGATRGHGSRERPRAVGLDAGDVPCPRYIPESNADLPRAARAGAAPRSTRSRPGGAPAARRRRAARSSSTSASATSGTRGTSPGRASTFRAATSSRGSRRCSPTRRPTLVLYCASGARSAFAAKTLGDLGYENASTWPGGFADWKRNGYECTTPAALTPAQRARYTRHLLIPEVGEEGQLKLLDSRVLLIGAGGLGSPAALYLAAAGVGTIGIIDADVVDESNLQRQIVHSTEPLGEPKVASAKRTIEALNPDVEVIPIDERLTSENVEPDPRRRLGRDRRRHRQLPDPVPRQRRLGVARHPRRPRLDLPLRGPGHGLQARRRAVLPLPLSRSAAAGARAELRRGRRARRPAGDRRLAPGERGVEARARHRRLARRPAAALRRAAHDLRRGDDPRNPDCPVCGEHPTITEYIDYVEFCSSPSRPAEAPAGQSPAPPLPAAAAPSMPSGAEQSTVPSGLNGAATTREAEEGWRRT